MNSRHTFGTKTDMKQERKNKTGTCRERELYLFTDDFHGDEVMFLVEAAVVEQQTVGLFGRKSTKQAAF